MSKSNKKSKILIRLFSFYILSLLGGTALFILLINVRSFDKLDILFFRTLVLLVISCFIIAVVALIIKQKSPRFTSVMTYRDIILICTLLFSFNFFLYLMVPFNVSRSNSILLISYLNIKKGSPQTEDEITKFVFSQYFSENKAISVRLREQIISGNVERKGRGYVLTPKGEVMVQVLSAITDVYNVKENFLKPPMPKK